MTNQPFLRVSVITPVYKTPLNYFKECLDSLCNQTMLDAEFLLVFDGENKELLSICETYKEKDGRFKTFIQPHLGVSATRNFGIERANGEYITFVDADDSLFSNSVLELGYNYSRSNKSDITLFNWISEKQQEKKIWEHSKEALSNEEKKFCLIQMIHLQHASFSGAPWAKFFSRDFLLKNKITFKQKCIIGQDRVFNYEAFSKAKIVSYSTIFFYKYSLNEKSATKVFRPDYLPMMLNYIEELNILSNNNFPSLIGRETFFIFYQSWGKCYMNPQNKLPLFRRLGELSHIAKTDRFQFLIREIDAHDFSLLFNIEKFLLKKRITFWIYIHGIKYHFLH